MSMKSINAIACALALGGTSAFGQGFPSRPIRIETGSVGSNGDVISRLVGPTLASGLGQPVLVENRTSGIILGETVARSSADGHTLLVTGSSFWLAPFLEQKVPWDPLRDFAPISLLSTSPNLIVVHPSVPANSVKELIALIRARPGVLNYASGATGSAPHLAAELFNTMAQVQLVRINYKGIGPAMNDLIGGQVQVMFPNGGGVVDHLKSGRLKGLAVTSAKPTALFPNLPTVAASGLPGYEAEVLNGLFAPAKTPAAVTARIHQEVGRALERSDIRAKLFNTGVEVIAGGPDDLLSAMKREMSAWGKLIQDQGIRNY